MFIELGERQRCDLAVATIDEIELGGAIEQRLRILIGGELPATHDDAAERAVLRGEAVTEQSVAIEGAILHHHARDIG
ncbi:hypothetical protein D3C84_1047670 [compost metagenome]